MSGRCDTCEHWDGPSGPIVVNRRPYGEPLDGEWGTCERIRHIGIGGNFRLDVEEHTTDPAFLADGSGYFAALACRADFGCTLHEGHP